MSRPQRDLLEINEFQLRVLKPFYAAVICASVFFALMVYAAFFFPDQYSRTTLILTRCEPQTSFPVVLAVILSFIFSLGAFLLADRQSTRRTDFSQEKGKNDRPLLSVLTAGFALLFSVSLLVLIIFQKYVIPQLDLNRNLLKNIEPHHIIVVAGGFGAVVLVIGLFFWAYGISNKVLGPYDRIIRELDDIVAGKQKKDLTVRPQDEMFSELVARINILIKRQKDEKNDR